MATDGRRVYAMFANGDCAAFTLEGQPVWSKSFGALNNPYGHATSLATWRDRLIVQLDQGDSEDNKSKLYALEGRTGESSGSGRGRLEHPGPRRSSLRRAARRR